MKSEDKQVIHVKRADHSCGHIERGCLANPRLTWKSKGVLAWFVTRKAGERITMEMVIAASRNGRKCVQSCMRELQGAGHAELIVIRDKKGHTIGKQWRIHEIPLLKQVSNPVKQQPRDLKGVCRPAERPKRGLSGKGSVGEMQLFDDQLLIKP